MEYDPMLTARYLNGKVDEFVKQAARDTIMQNVRHDKARKRYARIPDGNACEFCSMLGSRGFVYHTEAKAGGAGQYHPHCNCQIAVSFDVAQESYYMSGTRVTRGYAMEADVVRPGRDGSRELRDVDIDELFERYRAAGRDFKPKASRVFQGARDLMGGTKLPPDEFQAAMQQLADAKTLDELHAVGKDIVDKWPRNQAGRNPEQWREMSRFAQELEKRFQSLNGTQALRVKSYSLSTKYTVPDSTDALSNFARYETVELERYSKNKDRLAGWVKKQDGATPDEWEEKSADVLASIGFDVKFKARSLSERRADATIDGKRWEFKNPSGSGYLCVHNQIKSNLYGENKHKLKPQSSRVVISNVRSTLTLDQMEEQLRRVMDGESGFTDKELSKIEAVLLLDKNGKARLFRFKK